MTGIKEIRNKIKSIKSTQKITRAMEMVAASKMRKAQQRMQSSRPYANRLRDVIAHLVQGSLEYVHPYMVERRIKKAGIIVIASDRGLCGGLNNNLFKAVIKKLKELETAGIVFKICTIGAKATHFFKRINAEIIASAAHIGDPPSADSVIGPMRVMLDAYDNGDLDVIFLAYNDFINTMTQRPTVEHLLPVTKAAMIGLTKHGDTVLAKLWDYIYEPSAYKLLDSLLIRYFEALVYHGVIENIACEQAARMIAMKSATDNAGELIDEFQLLYNKARQAVITKELAEIVSGAQAV